MLIPKDTEKSSAFSDLDRNSMESAKKGRRKRRSRSGTDAPQHKTVSNGVQSLKDQAAFIKPTSNGVGSTEQIVQARPVVGTKRRKLSTIAVSGTEQPFSSFLHTHRDVCIQDSRQTASQLFKLLIHPMDPKKFFRDVWEQQPCVLARHMPNYNNGWFSCAELDSILRRHTINFSEHLDVVSYSDGTRKTHNPHGRAYAPVVWDFYQNGCSVRLLNPQSYSKNVWKLLSLLREKFNSFVGANVYLTPPNTQGFAPHYDDIEAFILQLEGKKHWRVYKPTNDEEVLPLLSSKNLSQDEIGEAVIDTVLEPGDLLYMPRGYIHQGKTVDGKHSLHITVSAAQKHSWGSLLEKILPQALQMALSEDLEFRKSLPIDYLNYMGVTHEDNKTKSRETFVSHVTMLMKRLADYASIDAACDQKAVDLLHESLPPMMSRVEREVSMHGNGGECWHPGSAHVRGAAEIGPNTEVKLIRHGIARLVTTDEGVRLYHCVENTRFYHKVEHQYIELEDEMAMAVEHLTHSYPEFCTVDSLPELTLDAQLNVASLLFDKGIIMTRTPLESVSGGSDSS